MSVLRSIALFLVAALAEIGGAWLVWQGLREQRGLLWIGAGILALAAYGFAATFQPDPNFVRATRLSRPYDATEMTCRTDVRSPISSSMQSATSARVVLMPPRTLRSLAVR
ncbi:hypothetical protein ACTWPT_54570 [Nonomuraea sp. 3N208]|uniref:hypothetical protein n=1 Tax=Nonomuraea sp. 3N208 TaxID=3457421 RepID=UPI003FD2E892